MLSAVGACPSHVAVPRRSGRIESFDAAAGVGTVMCSGGRRLVFHSAAIADGSRLIDVGVGVTFTPRAAHLGQFEAVDLVSVPA